MASLIRELENNEALLLMYFTDELLPEDRAEVEQLLSVDAGLRDHLAKIGVAYTDAMGALETLDRDRSAQPGEDHAIRQASRAMKQWQVDRLNRQSMVIPSPRIKMPVWAYPIGVAAMLVIGALIWWGGQADTVPATSSKLALVNPVGPSSISTVQAVVSPEELIKANMLENSLKGEVPVGISDAETQANSLIARSDSDAVASSIFLNGETP